MRWKKTGEEGLLTVEAILGLVPFILVILGIISFIDIFAVHNKIQYAMHQMGNEISAYTYFYEALGIRSADLGLKADADKQTEPLDKTLGPLNSYISLSEDASDTSGVPLAESISWREDNPEQILIERENVEQFLEEIRSNLSPLEQKVLTDYLDGMNYRQIAEKWNKPEKSIDNALQRIKSKVQKLRSCK